MAQARYDSTVAADLAVIQQGFGIIGLKPTGYDQASEIQTYFRDTGGVRNGLDFGEGDYIIGSPIVLYARDTAQGGQGIGFTMTGAGPGRTKLKYTGDKTQHAITITDPNAATVARRDYLNKIDGLSIQACDSGGNVLSGLANLDGSAVFAGPVTGLGYGGGHVLHTTIMDRTYFDGWKYGLTLDDVTLFHARNVWMRDFLEGVRLGGNIDIVTFEHCMFGSEQYGTSYRNACSAVKTGWVGINGPSFTGGSNNVTFDHCWFMKHGAMMEDILTNGSKFRFVECYFEDMLQVYKNVQTSGIAKLRFETCHFSEVSDNDGPAPKIQLPAVQNCEVDMINCDGPESYGPIGGYIGFYDNFGRVNWENSKMGAGAGHITHRKAADVCAFTGSISGTTLTVTAVTSGSLQVGKTIGDAGGLVAPGTRLLDNGSGGGGVGTYTVNISQTVASEAMTAFVAVAIPDLGDHRVTYGGATSTWRLSGERIRATNFPTAGTVLCRPDVLGDDFVFTTSGAVTTLDAPLFNALDGSRIKFTITAAQSTHTITWHSRFVFSTTFVQPSVNNTTTIIEFEQRKSKWVQISGPNVWF